jgi:hypothetical protein
VKKAEGPFRFQATVAVKKVRREEGRELYNRQQEGWQAARRGGKREGRHSGGTCGKPKSM